ncbi:AlpA family phage regulatory protein [Nitrosomonas oligotropha]|uniref:helix-turn-helix transcriptional regulator n=1 Tax=Nitrosomonas oligotropha TaxID=42354 RepID=UPI00136CA445|nr:AlpA family phage regulatory protein [Nitrosomonas oligotropha]
MILNSEDIQYPEIILIRIKTVILMTGLSRSAIYSRLQPSSPYYDPDFPRQVKLANGRKGASAWSLKEIEDWIRTRLNNRK